MMTDREIRPPGKGPRGACLAKESGGGGLFAFVDRTKAPSNRRTATYSEVDLRSITEACQGHAGYVSVLAHDRA
jgi:hypothetical protein